MSQDYKLNYFEMFDKSGENQSPAKSTFASPTYIRNLNLCWPNGDMYFANYAYLTGGRYSAEHGLITLYFTDCTVEIKGSKLQELYKDLLSHLVQNLQCMNERYVSILEADQFIVTDISVIK